MPHEGAGIPAPSETIDCRSTTPTMMRAARVLDLVTHRGVIILTYHGHEDRPKEPEDQGSRRRRDVEPPPREGWRSEIPGQRLLRPLRRGAGQVRDAAAGRGRERLRHDRRRAIRRLTTDVLPG